MAGAIDAMVTVGEECLSTSFLMWCQNACAWYLGQTENHTLRAQLQDDVASARRFGGTALSNPMKHFADIEPLRLKGRRVSDGYVLDGQLPWVSNLGVDHVFGAIFGVDEGAGDRRIMALIDCANPGVSLRQDAHFTALEGTRTFSVRFNDAFIPDSMVLADPAEAMVARIRAGFVLLQTGMGIGLVRDCVEIMQRSDRSLEHVNRYLDDRPEDLAAELEGLSRSIRELAATPIEAAHEYMRSVLQARADISTLSLRAATSALLHAGARGYLSHAPAQRRLREAHFVAIVTQRLNSFARNSPSPSRLPILCRVSCGVGTPKNSGRLTFFGKERSEKRCFGNSVGRYAMPAAVPMRIELPRKSFAVSIKCLSHRTFEIDHRNAQSAALFRKITPHLREIAFANHRVEFRLIDCTSNGIHDDHNSVRW